MKNNPYVKNLKTAVFDIETMGLFPSHDMLVLGGIYSVSEDRMFQFFCEDSSMERETVANIIASLAEFDVIITYNGDSFDWPFLRKRAEKNGCAYQSELFHSVDLYRWLKTYWPQAKNMPSLRQKAVEEALGFSDHRTDEVSGSDCVDLYKRYLHSKDTAAKEALLLHNHDDVLQLNKIANSLTFLPFHKIASEQGFFLKEKNSKIIVQTVSLTGNAINVSALTRKALLPISIYDEGYRLEYDSENGKINLTILCRKRDHSLFVDLRELPVSILDFSPLPGYHNDFLVVAEDGVPLHRELNNLAGAILKSVFKEELPL